MSTTSSSGFDGVSRAVSSSAAQVEDFEAAAVGDAEGEELLFEDSEWERGELVVAGGVCGVLLLDGVVCGVTHVGRWV